MPHIWSTILQKEFIVPDFTDPNTWLLNTEDTIMMFSFAAVFTVVRKIVQDLSYQVGLAQGVTKRKAHKFSESAWKSVYYTVSLAFGLWLVHNGDYWPNTMNCWTNYPNFATGYDRYYYLFELGFYVHSLIVHFLFEIRRSDYYILFLHHVVTIGLVWFSYVVGYWKIGILVLVLHDCADVPLETAKAFNELGYEKTATTGFVILIITWLATRLSTYPYKLLYSSWYESHLEIPPDVMPFHDSLNYALFILQIMHVYWFFLIVRTAIRTLTGNHLHDVRDREKEE